MKKTFIVERMTRETWGRYMGGASDNITVEILKVMAEDKQDAIKQAETSGYVVNKYSVTEIELV